MFIGIDLGTSSVKAVVLDRGGEIRASATRALSISNPYPRWSEQNPEEWWLATQLAIEALLAAAGKQSLSARDIAGIGLSGQMHGATLLDASDKVLRPAILWNDGRCDLECAELEGVLGFRKITGNLAMPGFTAPKLLWVRNNEPRIFERTAKVLLPKDYLRLRLTGEYATDLSDASGTLWLNVGKREWSDALLTATSLTRTHMPVLHEGNAVTGRLRAELAQRWGMQQVPVAAGAGDNAAGAIGMGVVRPGQTMLSLGTSGVIFTVSRDYLARPEQAIHGFCHALPQTWHAMSVMLNAASCLDFTAQLTGYADVPTLLTDAEAHVLQPEGPWFLPYLSGERTPHNDPYAKGAFIGLNVKTRRADLANATLEGVALGMLDGLLALQRAGSEFNAISVIGGGARSAYWMRMLADVLGKPLAIASDGEMGPALGAARLAHLATEPSAVLADVCPNRNTGRHLLPDARRHAVFAEQRYPMFAQLYRNLRPLFRPAITSGQ